jgi:hypothetical protein
VPRAEIVWRLHFMLGAMSYAIAGTDVLQVITGLGISDASGEALDAESEAKKLAERLMPFLLGGLRAPLPLAVAATAKPAPRRSSSLAEKRR